MNISEKTLAHLKSLGYVWYFVKSESEWTICEQEEAGAMYIKEQKVMHTNTTLNMDVLISDEGEEITIEEILYDTCFNRFQVFYKNNK